MGSDRCIWIIVERADDDVVPKGCGTGFVKIPLYDIEA
jgi:hypothetical protein